VIHLVDEDLGMWVPASNLSQSDQTPSKPFVCCVGSLECCPTRSPVIEPASSEVTLVVGFLGELNLVARMASPASNVAP
jgi:hypothetical protein